MKLGSRSRLGMLLAMGAFGALCGHGLGYAIAHPSGPERDAVLHASGHGYMDMAIGLALVAGVVALLGEFLLGYLGREMPGRALPFRSVWWILASAQLVAFIFVEVAERALNGMGPTAVLSEPAFWVGLPLQALIAGCVALVLTFARKAGTALRTRLHISVDAERLEVPIGLARQQTVAAWIGFAFYLRGPPLLQS